MKTSFSQISNQLFQSVALLIVCIGMPSIAMAQGVNDIPWLTNVEQAKQVALQENKLVLLHFEASWCRPCKALETYVFKSSAVKKAIAENVVPVRLDADVALDMVDEFEVSMVPYDVIITPGGRIVTERRSPSDSENYSKMIASVSSASRSLEKEKLGPIAHQRETIQNQLIGQNPTDFRAKGPQAESLDLAKDGSLLKRRQESFSNATNSVRQTNPWVDTTETSGSAARAAAPSASATRSAAPSGSATRGEVASVSDLQRNEFLGRERNWVAPSQQTRRAKPERIVNSRYFDSIAKREAQAKPDDEFVFDDQLAESTTTGEISSGHGNFKTPEPQTPAATIVDVSVDSPDLLDLDPAPPEIVTEKFCLSGKCPVTLLTEGRWVDGDTQFGIVHRNRTYIFQNAEKLAQFRTDPDKYSPILAGYDPVVYEEEGTLVDGLVENGVFMGKTPEQKVVLFSDNASREKFQSSPQKYLEAIRIATMNARKNRIR